MPVYVRVRMSAFDCRTIHKKKEKKETIREYINIKFIYLFMNEACLCSVGFSSFFFFFGCIFCRIAPSQNDTVRIVCCCSLFLFSYGQWDDIRGCVVLTSLAIFHFRVKENWNRKRCWWHRQWKGRFERYEFRSNSKFVYCFRWASSLFPVWVEQKNGINSVNLLQSAEKRDEKGMKI